MNIHKHLQRSENGIAHLIIVLVVMVFAAVGGVGYYVFSKNQKKETSKSQTSDKKYDDQRVDNAVINDLKGTEFDE